MSYSPVVVSFGIGIVAVGVVSVVNALRSSSRPPLPPGPKGYPLIGNVMDMPGPNDHETEHWLKHKAKYGPISSVSVLGTTLVLINDPKIAVDLMEKRSTKHSTRPKSYFAGEMIGWENALGLAPYNHQFRVQRKTMGRVIGSKNSAAVFAPLQEEEVGHFLLHVLNEPDNSVSHIRRMAGAIMLKIAYDYNVDPFHDDPLVNMAGDAVTVFVQNALPLKWAVDMIPQLRYLPDWFPGTGFKQAAKQWKAELDHVTNLPYAFVKHQMAEGKDTTSFLARLIEAEAKDPELKELNKWTASVFFSGGVDTTVASITWCHLAMTLYPEAQRKAQEELDRVVGQDRLPTLADRENLPYMQALIKEVLRWHTVSPLGVPHASTEDDEYNGFFIPKGAILLPNVGHFASDPDVYDDPATFKPERFLTTDGQEPASDPRAYVFGFGRRLCPGQYLAENALFLNISQTLAVFNISKKIVDGKAVEPVIRYQPGGISHPEPFQNVVKPRSAHHEKLIRSLEEKYPWRESDRKIMDSLKV